VKQAILLAAVSIVAHLATDACAQNYRFEAELGTRGGSFVATSTPGYSGTGYVSFNSDTAQFVQVQANVPDGLYDLWIGYNSPFGFKGYDYLVDGVAGSGGFDGNGSQWGTDRAGTFDLTGATNTLRINRGWGWYNVDYFELRPFAPPALLPVSNQLVDPQADRPTQMLMNYLVSQYGQKTLSGLQHNSSDNLSFPVNEYLGHSGGVVPAIRGSDLIEYSPSRVQNSSTPDNETEQTIAWAKQTGGIVSVMWHWNAPANLVNTPCGSNCGPNDYPWWRGFYTQGTTFNLAGALANPAGNDYQLLLRDIDAIAVQLQKYEDAGVPVIWRPLHEAQGNEPDGDAWFWWGAHGAENFKSLWRLMHERLTEHHGLHNLIWEFTSSAAKTGHLDWYPGDDVVDIVGLDVYTEPSSTMNGEWYDVLAHYNGRKMLALSETDTLVDPDTMDKWNTKWSYVAPWAWDYVRREYQNAGYSDAQISALLQDFLNDENVITLGELPVLPWSNAAGVPGDYNEDGSVDAADYSLWRDSLGQSGTGLAADGNGDGVVNQGDYDVWRLYFGVTAGGATGSTAVPEPGAAMLFLLGPSVAAVAKRGAFRSVRGGGARR
jgi:mannan endo-1,4-beta-mannosidase